MDAGAVNRISVWTVGIRNTTESVWRGAVISQGKRREFGK